MRALATLAALGALLLSAAGAVPALAGRPVFHGLSLEELAARADAIAVVTPGSPLARKDGCLTHYRFRLVEVLKAKDAIRLPSTGKELRVSDAGLAANVDCEARRGKPGGVSFAAERYERPEGPFDLAGAGSAIVFLAAGADGAGSSQELRFAADGAWETLEARSRVERALGKAASPSAGPFENAVARSDCAPWDGPALTVLLAPATARDGGPSGTPRLSISVWDSPRTLAGRTVALPAGGKGGGTAVLETDGSPPPLLKRGTVRLDRVEPGSAVEGAYDLTFEDGRRLTGTFRARWDPRVTPCR